MDGAIGIVREIFFENSEGQRHQKYTMPTYIVVEFPKSYIYYMMRSVFMISQQQWAGF